MHFKVVRSEDRSSEAYSSNVAVSSCAMYPRAAVGPNLESGIRRNIFCLLKMHNNGISAFQEFSVW